VLAIMNSLDRLNRTEDHLTRAAAVADRILERVLPDWWHTVPAPSESPWEHRRHAAVQATGLLEHQEALHKVLGADAPSLDAARLHRWAWEAARSLWRSRHYRQAVVKALKRV
jgi:hypothetical protein